MRGVHEDSIQPREVGLIEALRLADEHDNGDPCPKASVKDCVEILVVMLLLTVFALLGVA